jgi:hypothetical protein
MHRILPLLFFLALVMIIPLTDVLAQSSPGRGRGRRRNHRRRDRRSSRSGCWGDRRCGRGESAALA